MKRDALTLMWRHCVMVNHILKLIIRPINTMQNKTMFKLWDVQYIPRIIYTARTLLCFAATGSMFALIYILHA